ncbi:MAG: DUF4926 domain-containing protein [Planctomycetota bacterium]|jgi:hypothetical protein
MSSEPNNEESAAPTRHVRVLDVVALMEDRPEVGLFRGHVGTVAEPLHGNVFEVEFSDDGGKAYALVPVPADQLLVLHHRPVRAG